MMITQMRAPAVASVMALPLPPPFEDDFAQHLKKMTFASPNNIVNPLTHSYIFLLLPMKNVNPALFVFSFRDYLNDIYVASH